jgi:hypothetical protein
MIRQGKGKRDPNKRILQTIPSHSHGSPRIEDHIQKEFECPDAYIGLF